MTRRIFRTTEVEGANALFSWLGGLLTALWGVLMMRIGKNEVDMKDIAKRLQEHTELDHKLHTDIMGQMHDMHVDLLTELRRKDQ